MLASSRRNRAITLVTVAAIVIGIVGIAMTAHALVWDPRPRPAARSTSPSP